jgi:5-methylcytosine-specific restriction enzyme A
MQSPTTKRFLGKYFPANELPKNEDGFVKCRFCEKSVKPPRRTMCSAECAHEMKLRTSGKYLRECVFKRDRGICVFCGEDTKLIARKAIELKNNRKIDELNLFLKENDISLKRKIWKKKFGGGLWDADHIIQVKDGGGQCGLDNVRTLCIKCHKKRTFKKSSILKSE